MIKVVVLKTCEFRTELLLTILREGTQHGGAGGVQLVHVRVCVCGVCVFACARTSI